MKLIVEIWSNLDTHERVYSTSAFNSKEALLDTFELCKSNSPDGCYFEFLKKVIPFNSEIEVYELDDWFENSKLEKI